MSPDPASTDEDLFGAETPTATITVEAPYGLNPRTGKPYTMSPEARQAASDRMAAGRTAKAMAGGSKRTRAAKAARSAGPPPPMRPPGGTAKPKAPKQSSRGQALAELFDGIGFGVAFLGRRLRNVPLMADGVAFGMHGGALGMAIGEFADGNEAVGAALDFLDRVSPYTKIVTALVPFGAQLAANHGFLPAGMFGSADPQALADMFLANQPTEAQASARDEELRDQDQVA